MARRLPIGIAIAVALVVSAGLLVPRAIAAQHGNPATWVAPAPAPAAGEAQTGTGGGATGRNASGAVSVNFGGEFLGWAMLDRSAGTTIGENLDETSSTESMVKTWLVADFLRRESAAKTTPTTRELVNAREAIRWSDDNAAEDLYRANGGNTSITRMITMCGLTETTVYDDWWSRTQMSPRDAVRLGECLVNGTAAGTQWTPWLLDEMRSVQGSTSPADQEETRGGGRWGIIDGVPASQTGEVAIKNGWTARSDGNWHLNCLAVTDDWSISVMMRYPNKQGLDYGAGICEDIARQLLT